MKKETVDSAMTVLREVSTIVLGTKKNGKQRSIVDAKVKLEKERRKSEKKKNRKI